MANILLYPVIYYLLCNMSNVPTWCLWTLYISAFLQIFTILYNVVHSNSNNKKNEDLGVPVDIEQLKETSEYIDNIMIQIEKMDKLYKKIINIKKEGLKDEKKEETNS